MEFVELEELVYYIGCNQYNNFFYNLTSNTISDIENIVLMLSVSKNEFLDNYFYYDYIPLPGLNITEAFDGFIISLNNKKISEYFKGTKKTDILNYWLKFDKIFHVGLERRLWNEYYDNYVKRKAIDWCNEYGICYH